MKKITLLTAFIYMKSGGKKIEMGVDFKIEKTTGDASIFTKTKKH